jgi:hypothetical protein
MSSGWGFWAIAPPSTISHPNAAAIARRIQYREYLLFNICTIGMMSPILIGI